MEINVQSEIGQCTEYMDKDGQQSITVVIAPIKVMSGDENKAKIVTGCNMWKSCLNTKCYYSAAARNKKA